MAALFLFATLPICGTDFGLSSVWGQTKVRPTLLLPNGLALDAKGDLYISDIGAHQIFKLEKDRLMLIAGTGDGGFGGDGGPATKAQLFAPHDLLFDADGNLLVADTQNHRIRRIDRRGIITTIAGDGSGSKASLNNPQSIALDGAGNLLIADTYNHLIRRVDRNGAMTTFAGTQAGFDGDGGPATKAQMSLPMAVTVAPDGSVFVADGGNSRIRRIAPDGKIQTVAGFGPAQDTYGGGFAGDGGPAEKAKIFIACDLKTDSAGNLFISDSGNNRLRVIRGGVMNTIAGSGQPGFGGDGGDALKAELNAPQKIVLAAGGSIFLADRANHRVRKIDAKDVIRTIAGDGNSQK
ncbi:MAG TPA: hypothetical protein PLD20_21145 [Blastocatellia bacterium]|nr:hypothetical protein [Blastocatellia bacterium]HMZ20457.1 hypothetical protein [Blastocatellia bacterium]HNG30019.1 hypothetical protein [Blastocatellia bacterium]